ncbi:hypothetical protein L9F63_011185, partial [Diploptera punctata]
KIVLDVRYITEIFVFRSRISLLVLYYRYIHTRFKLRHRLEHKTKRYEHELALILILEPVASLDNTNTMHFIIGEAITFNVDLIIHRLQQKETTPRQTQRACANKNEKLCSTSHDVMGGYSYHAIFDTL